MSGFWKRLSGTSRTYPPNFEITCRRLLSLAGWEGALAPAHGASTRKAAAILANRMTDGPSSDVFCAVFVLCVACPVLDHFDLSSYRARFACC
jgi:hypothetical protein